MILLTISCVDLFAVRVSSDLRKAARSQHQTCLFERGNGQRKGVEQETMIPESVVACIYIQRELDF